MVLILQKRIFNLFLCKNQSFLIRNFKKEVTGDTILKKTAKKRVQNVTC